MQLMIYFIRVIVMLEYLRCTQPAESPHKVAALLAHALFSYSMTLVTRLHY